MKFKPLPAVARVRELLNYDPETGVLTWRVARRGPAVAGSVAGTPVRGYVHVMVDGTLFYAHRLAWLLATGDDPGASQVDHRDGNRANNRLANLRLATHAENARNQRKQTTGRYLKGAWRLPSGRFQATIKAPLPLYLGTFDNEQAAHEAYVAAAKHHFGEFANAG